jgi:hypothetical protein
VGSQHLALTALLPDNGLSIHLRRLGNPQGFDEEKFFAPLGIEVRTLPVLLFRSRHYKYRVVSLANSYYSLLLKYQSGPLQRKEKIAFLCVMRRHFNIVYWRC